MLEENFRRALLLSRGSFATFVERPISGTLLAIVAAFIVWQLATFIRTARRGVTVAEPRPPLGEVGS
jgi:TctA family transporter